jgi:hypothetical protein
MIHTNVFLPAFDAHRIESYFFDDFDAIKEIFKVTHENIGYDLKKIAEAFTENDVEQLEHTLHDIKPLFNFIGLPEVERLINELYSLSLKAASTESLKDAHAIIWPALLDAQKLIEAQHHLFEVIPTTHIN